MSSFSIRNTTRGKLPSLPLRGIKEAVLGNTYDLSVAFVTPAEARLITRKTKKKDHASNVLAFPLSPNSGEIVICPTTARRQAPAYGYDAPEFLARLFIHACFHLAGLRHGATMEHEEDRTAQRFGLS